MRISAIIKRPTILLLLLGAVVSGAIAPSPVHGTDASVIRLEAGQTVEIGTDTNSPNSQFSWILTKERQFIGAQRTRFFQTRLADPGTYTLDVSSQDPLSNESGYRAFTLFVSPPAGMGNPVPRIDTSSDAFSAVLRTDPPAINGIVYLPPEGGVIKLDPSSSMGTIASYSLDLDGAVDSNGDGNALNDRDNQGTISERQGTSIFLFMMPKASPRTVTLTTTDLASGLTTSTSLAVAFSDPPAEVQPVNGSLAGGPIVMEANGLIVRFSTQLDPASTQGKSLLTEWDFGDHLKSLLETPQHTYGAPGSYTVTLSVRDIATGEIVSSGTASVEVSAPQTTASASTEPSSVASSDASSDASDTSQDNGLGIGSFLTVGFIVLLLLGGAVALYVVLQWIKGKTTASLQRTLEKMENTLVKKEVSANPSTVPEPMKLNKEAPKPSSAKEMPEREKAKTEFTSRTRTNEAPTASAGPAPSWLANSGAKASPSAQPPPAPAQPKMTPAPAANGNGSAAAPAWLTQAPKPPSTSPAPTAMPPATATAGTTPPWLAKAQAMPATPSGAPATMPQTTKPLSPPPVAVTATPIVPPAAPIKPDTPVPVPTSAPVPAPIPTSAPTPVPSTSIPAMPTPEGQTPMPPPQAAKPQPAPIPHNPAPQATAEPPPQSVPAKPATVIPPSLPENTPIVPVTPPKPFQDKPATEKPDGKETIPPPPAVTTPPCPPPKPATAMPPSQPENTPIVPATPPKSPEQKTAPALPDQKQPALDPPAVKVSPAPQPKPAAVPAQPEPSAPAPAVKPTAPANPPAPAEEAAPIRPTKTPPVPAIKPKEAEPPIAIIQADSLNA